MLHNYFSIASSDYAYKVLTLYRSVARHDREYRFFIVCMDENALNAFKSLKLENAELISIDDIEVFYPELHEIRKTRNDKEYAWTVKPSAFLYIFETFGYVDHLLWLDGDTMFLSDPRPIYMEWGKDSILLTLERYSGKYSYMSCMYGIYNTGLLGFKRDQNAFECLKWLQAKVNEWCYDKMENGLWSDQLYVNSFFDMFNSIRVIKDIGINMTPFILWRFTEDEKMRPKVRNGDIYIRNKKLVLFHYYGFRYRSSADYELCSYKDWGLSEAVIQAVYQPYIKAYEESIQQFTKVNETPEKKQSSCSFCTITTMEYVPKCLALLSSIKKHTDDFHLWICCMDNQAYGALTQMQLRNVTVIALSEIEDESLRQVKEDRKEYEYCWTLKAPLLLHIFKNYEDVESLLYVDSDIFLFSNPDRCFEILRNYPVYLTCHNFSERFRYLYKEKGRFNAGIVGFRRCSTALRCLKWWKRKCIEWCYDIIAEGRFADQKYIEEFAKPHIGAYTAQSVGMNAAIWNVRDVEVKAKDNNILIDGNVLVFYHFSSFLVLKTNEFDMWKWDYLGISDDKKELIYTPYVEAVAKAIGDIRPYLSDISQVFSDTGEDYTPFNYVALEDAK